MKHTLALLTTLLLAPLATLHAADAPKPNDLSPAFTAKLQTTLNQHLNQLLRADGSVAALNGKTAEGDGKDEAELKSPKGQKILADYDTPKLITKDAPPVFLVCTRPTANTGHCLHHPGHAMAVIKRCQEVGNKFIADVPAYNLTPAPQDPRTLLQFFTKYLAP